jgi:hypothetical protein
MDKSYVLGRNKTVFETAEFPQIGTDEKVAVIFEGDIESTLIAIIAKKLYGIDRVVFINDKLIAFDGTMGKSDAHKLDICQKTFNQGVEQLDGVHFLNVDAAIYKKNGNPTLEFQKLIAQKYNNKVKFVLSGYNKINEQSMLMLKASGYDKGKITNDKLEPWLENNKDTYRELYDYVFRQNGKIFGVNQYVDFETAQEDFYLCVRPFRNLTTSDVINLYQKLDATYELYRSSSCDMNLGNCGICSKCSKRKLAFDSSSVSDLTKYTFNQA